MNVKDEMRGKYEEVVVKYLIQYTPTHFPVRAGKNRVQIILRQYIQSSDGKSTLV